LPGGRQRVRGRVMLLDKQLLRLRNGEVRFVGEVVGSLPERTRHVEGRGVRRRGPEDGKLELVVDSLSPIAGELEEFQGRRKRLKNQPSKAWHALADWGGEIAAFYNDRGLAAAVQEVRDEAVALERREIPEGEGRALLAFSDRAAERGAGPGLLDVWRHEGCVWLVAQAEEGTSADRDQALEELRARLPDCEDPQADWDVELREKYLKSPVESYRNGSPGKRRVYRRMLYAETLLRWLQRSLLKDGSNHLEVARQIEWQIPEDKTTAARLRNGVLEARAREVERLTRTELLEVADRYRTRGDEAKARQLIDTWLAWRRKHLGEVDVEGGLALAQEYRGLLKQNAEADQLLIDLWQRVPGAEPLREALEVRGWVLHEGKWLSEEAYRRRPESRWDAAIVAARVEAGMPAPYVIRALGPPTSVVRMLTAGHYSEHWIFGESVGRRRVVRMERRGGLNELVAQSEAVEGSQATVRRVPGSPAESAPQRPLPQQPLPQPLGPQGPAPQAPVPKAPVPQAPVPQAPATAP